MVIINKTSGCRRNTPQRMKILDFLKSVHTHPTAEQVYHNVRKEIPSITLATVYRNLNLLAGCGEILRLEINHEYRYDAHVKNHIHFVCKNTGKIMDIENEKVNDFIKKALGKKFNAEKITILVKGTCEVN